MDKPILRSDLDRECPMRHDALAAQIADETRQIIEPVLVARQALPWWIKYILIPLIPVLIGGGVTVYIHQDSKREAARVRMDKRREARQLKRQALHNRLSRIEAALTKR